MRDFGIRPGIRRLVRLPLSSATRARAEADAELDAFLEAKTDYLVARGVPASEARSQALASLGASLDDTRQRLYHSIARRENRMQRRERIDDVLQDARYALRALRRAPLFTAVVIL